MQLPEYLRGADPRDLDSVERAILFSHEVHEDFEMALESLDPALIARVEDELFEMIVVVRKVLESITDHDRKQTLLEILAMLEDDYQAYV